MGNIKEGKHYTYAWYFDITVHSEPGPVTMEGEQSGKGYKIHLQITFHLRTLSGPRANLI